MTRPMPHGTPLTRRSLLLSGLGAGAALALAGCGSSDSSAGPAVTPARTSANGLPLDPKRVMAMYATDADFAYVLGFPLVGSFSTATTGFPAYQAGIIKPGVKPILTFPETDYEQIAALRPDLIFHGALSYSPEDEAPLKKVAPIYSFPPETVEDPNWRVSLREAAKTFERGDVGEKNIAAYEARAATLRSKIQARWAGATFAYVGPMEAGQFYIAQPEMQTNFTLHDDLGLAFSKAVPKSLDDRRTDISYEEMELLNDADIILLRTNPKDGSLDLNTEQISQVTKAPLWPTLPAVRAGNAFQVPGDLFYSSPVTASANLDWAEKTLLAPA